MSEKRFSLDDDFSPSPSDGAKRLDSDDFSTMRDDSAGLDEPDFDLQEGDYPEFVRPMAAISDEDDSQRPTISASPSDLDATDLNRQTVMSDVRPMVVDNQDERPTMLARRQELPPIDDRVRGVMTKKEPGRRLNRRGGGFAPGCVTIGLLFSAASLGIALLAAFVPPFADSNPLAESLWESASESSIELTTDETQVTHEGLTVDLPSQTEGDGFGVSIQSTSANDFMAGNTPSEGWQCGPAQSLPRSLSLQSTVYSLQSEGQAPAEVGLTLSLSTPDDSQNAMHDLYGWFGEAWQFIPSQPSSTGQALATRLPRLPLCLLLAQAQAPLPLVGVTLGLDQTLDPAIGSSINRLLVGGMQPTPQGALQGVLPSGLESNAGYSLIPTIANFRDPAVVDVLTVEVILSDPTLRASHAQQIAEFAAAGNYNGLALDYRDIPASLRQHYSELVRLLAEALHAQNQRLILFLPPAEQTESGWQTGTYDWRTLGWWADELVVRAPSDLGSFPDGQAEAMLRWAVGEVNRSQLFWGLSALSSDQLSLIPAEIAWEGLSRSGYSTLEASIEGKFGLVSLSYLDADTPQRQFWINSPTVLARQMGLGARLGLGGVIVLDMAQAETGDWAAPLQAYQEGALNAGLESPSLHWRILDEQGAVVDEQIAQVGQPIRYAPGSVAQASQFEAVLIAPEGELTLASGPLVPASTPQTVAIAPTSIPTLVAAQVSPTATVASVSPTATLAPASPTPTLLPATPTPLPSATFTATIPPTPSLTPTIVPTINAPLVQGILPAEFEIGVHKGYEYTDDKFNLMRIGGMVWVKVQIRYAPGMNADDYGWQIQFLHERGFKILWGVVGDKNEVLTPGYAQQYAEFVARLAEIGSDAIEIWNEPNLDREWPTGQVSGASYTEFLRTSYIAIKAKNPDTMVISAATAPTGFFGGCQAAGCDDNVFYQQMASAGAAQYMDCIGAHYNEGIVPPTATSGDPRSEYPTRYLLANTDRAWQPFGGQLPVCYTELGYLTPEGFDGPLPRGFEWAQNVTVAQQASWLATTALLLAQSGKVRLMIIWNLDYQDYDPDPHGGFAIIRPDGTCPACDSLGLIKATPVPGGQ